MSFGFSKFFWVFLFSGIVLYSCENCDDCGPLQREPSVSLKFINQDSLNAVQDSLLILDSTIETINQSLSNINIDLEFYSDSLQTIDRLIAEGDTTLDEEKSGVETKIDELQTTFTDFQNLRIVEEEKVERLSVIQSEIENGKVSIDSLFSKIEKTTLVFGSDSLERFKFPLSVNLDSTSYDVFIEGNSYKLSLQYERNFNEDEKSRIEMVVSMIKVTDHTFNEVINSCEECRSNETTITVFF